MDIKSAFVNSDLDKEIYMQQPEGFNDGTGRVLKLHQALYGLKQAGRPWHQRLHGILLNFGYVQSSADECIFIKITRSNIKVISVYVDDLGLFTNKKEGMAHIKGELNQKFPMTDLGEMKKILGIRVERDRKHGTLKISQGPYIDIILAQLQMQDVNPISTPLNKTVNLTVPTESKDGPTINLPYAKAIRSIMYAALRTRSDIAFAIQQLSQFTTSYGLEHWTVVKHVLRYLKGTRYGGIIFRQEAGLNLEIFTDADYVNQANALSIGSGTIVWSSKKQRTVALSTMEAEYIALTEGTKQLV